jgi:DNA-binding HxlR family transcriptional regulator
MRKTSSTNFRNKISLEKDCGMAYTISLIGGRWKLSILGLLTDYRKLRYSELQKRLPGISERMLNLQLRQLEEDNLIVRTSTPQVPPRVDYSLSKKGQSLRAILGFYTLN